MMKTPRDQSVGAQMHIASQLLKRRMHARIYLLGYKITMEQIAVLEVLKFNGDMNMTEIAHATTKENAVITRMVDVLEREGMVARQKVAGDRRAISIHITEKGQLAFNKIIPDLVDEMNDATSCITKEEYDEAVRIMKKIIKHNHQF